MLTSLRVNGFLCAGAAAWMTACAGRAADRVLNADHQLLGGCSRRMACLVCQQLLHLLSQLIHLSLVALDFILQAKDLC